MVRKTVGFNEDGVQICKVLGYFEKRTEAMEYLMTYNKKQGLVNYDITLEDVYKATVADKYTSHDKCIPAGYISPHNALQPVWEASFAQIKYDTYESIMDTIPTASVKRNFKSLLNLMYRYAIKHNIVEQNIATNLDTAPMEKSTKHHPFSHDEMQVLWQHSSELPARLWLIYCYTGMRPTELRLIKTENVHLNEHYMIGGIKTVSSIDRDIPLADCILPFIKDMYRPDMEYLLQHKGKKYSARKLTDCLKKFCTEHNMAHIPHDGRHTCATLLHGAGINLSTIQHVLGHAGDSVTDRVYIHKQLPVMLEAVNKLPIF